MIADATKYRIGYDYTFLANKPFSHKNEIIDSTTVNVLFKVFDLNGQEIFFEATDGNLRDQMIYKRGKSRYLTDFLKCSFDIKNILHFKLNVPLLKEFGITLLWEPDSYSKESRNNGFLRPEMISEDEFRDIMRMHKELFDYSVNHSAQSTSFFTRRI
ncbi:hypothetical protein [Terribacillus saccharophilus]|uniref:hypothetical protein n=1 Tax=Terribacillus saccharophilus TaxID=361277 RepID=UPI002989F297|nr:hypothetical protein [Terribacillus saccharophilus]MCM3227700.1 hypothetical protein [Terribacillus saccharophilus]